MKIIQQGAEAIILLKDNQIIKNRIKKSYRINILDDKIRKARTKSEAKIIEKLQNIIPVPKLLKIDLTNKKIFLEYIKGKKLSENLENLKYKEISKQIAENITKLHNLNIIHGDLTTSNMIYVKDGSSSTSKPTLKNININNKNNFKIYFIDFGLAFHSLRIEDKAVDLHLLKQALDAKHYKIADVCFNIILKNYKPKDYQEIIKRISIIESRGRYKDKH